MADSDTIPEDETLHERAIRHANEAWTAETDNFDQGRDDQRFAAGDQWLVEARQEREGANRPVITVNRIMSFVRQVTGDVRRDTPAIKIAPAKGPASQEMAEVYNGAIRNIEQQSNAKAAYVQGAENACITGMGNIKVVTEYSDNDGFEQDIRIKRIPDPFAVVWDPAAREPDKSDARYLLEFTDIPKEEFKRQYPDAAPDSVPSGPNGGSGIAWFTLDTVRVAQYWYREPVKKLLLQLADGRIITSEDALKETKEGQSIEVVNKREVDTFAVKQVIISGHECLTKPNEWAGEHIPYAPVIGTEVYIDGRVIRYGMVRELKDPQRVYNYMRTAAVEAAALQPKMPWLIALDQVKGLEKWWDTAGTKNHPWMPYNLIPNAPALQPKRAEPALAQTGLDQQSLLAADELKAVAGIYDASLGARSNETSGRAILARQREGDTGTYHFIDNLGTGIRRIGIILVDLIPKIYDTPRVIRVLREDGSQDMVGVNVPQHDPLNDVMKRMNDLAAGEYDVTVITGPSFATRRQEASEGMQALIKAFPPLMAKAGDIVIKNMDIPGAEEIAKRLAPPEGPPQPDPKTMTEAMKNAATADKTAAETEGLHIDNTTKALQLETMMAGMHEALQQIQAFMAAMSGQGDQQQGGQPPGAPPGMPPPQGAMPGGPPEPPQMAELTPLELNGGPQQ